VQEAPGSDFAGTGRLQYNGIPDLRLGSSFFMGNTGQGDATFAGATLTMIEADAKYGFEGIEVDGILVFTNLSDAAAVNTTMINRTPTFTNFVGSQMLGWYLEGAYHLLHHLAPKCKHDAVAFVRYEDFNTQQSMPAGFAANPANDRHTLTFGASYLPIENVAIKADYMANWNEANAGVDQFNLGVGFYY
jgi:hypothetical protein